MGLLEPDVGQSYPEAQEILHIVRTDQTSAIVRIDPDDIVELPRFAGSSKKLNFDIKKFSKFKDKIEYIVVDKPPPNLREIKDDDNVEIQGQKKILNGYARDNYQRECLSSGLKNLEQDDYIIAVSYTHLTLPTKRIV